LVEVEVDSAETTNALLAIDVIPLTPSIPETANLVGSLSD